MAAIKYILALIIPMLANTALSQSGFPGFLQGTWKMENKEVYEHWDRLNENTLKGISYSMKDGRMVVSEYLDIVRKNNEIIYTATVLNQNQGKGIDFKLTKTGSTYTFENLAHDFPKRIIYQKLSGTEFFVEVSGANQNGFSYKMKKQK